MNIGDVLFSKSDNEKEIVTWTLFLLYSKVCQQAFQSASLNHEH